DQLDGGSVHYNMPTQFALQGQFSLAAFENALTQLFERHEVLRTTYHEVDGEGVQLIGSAIDISVPFVDASKLGDADARQRLTKIIQTDAQRPFDLSTDPMLRMTVVAMPNRAHVVVCNMHHIASDGWSMDVLQRELRELYAAARDGNEPALNPLTVQYADYAQWQRSSAQQAQHAADLNYWTEHLAGLPPLHSLPLDKPRPTVQTFNGGVYTSVVAEPVSAALDALCAEEGATVFMGLHAALSALLARYSHEADIVIGTPAANREHPALAPLIGFFVNTLVLRSDLSADPSYRQLLRQCKDRALAAYAHQGVAFERLVETLEPERSLSHTPLFQIMLAYQKRATVAGSAPNTIAIGHSQKSVVEKFDLSLNISDSAEGLRLSWTYNTDLFDPRSVESMSGAFDRLLEQALLTPDQTVTSLPLLTAADQTRIKDWNGAALTQSTVNGLHERVATQAANTPDAVAIRNADQTISYAELDTRVTTLSASLMAQGVGSGQIVGLCVERSTDMVIAMLAIMKTGAAYLPLDPAYPTARITQILRDAQPIMLLTDASKQAFARSIDWQGNTQSLDQLAATAVVTTAEAPRVAQSDPAYVIYTSGSTGQPKGVVVSHGSVLSYVQSAQKQYRVTPDDRWLQFSSVSFDVSVEEIFMTLCHGATLVLRNDALLEGGQALRNFLCRHGITVVALPTAFWCSLVDVMGSADDPILDTPVRLCIIGGEAISEAHLQRWYAVNTQRIELIDAYGPTETTISATLCVHHPDRLRQRPSIGRPIAGVTAHVLSANGAPAPLGASGMLHVSGPTVANGYLNRPQLTAERFIDLRGAQGERQRMYNTGDLARWSNDGELQFLGRLDQQVKVRGYRIELEEVSACFERHAGVAEAVAVLIGPPDRQHIAVYAVVRSGHALVSNDPAVVDFGTKNLPSFMLPRAVIVVPSIPLSPNGKVDLRQLPSIAEVAAGVMSAPATNTERALADIWVRLLDTDAVSTDASFFDLGGHSILAIKLISLINRHFGSTLQIRQLFEHPTIEALAAQIDANPNSATPWQPLVSLKSGDAATNVYCVPGVGMTSASFLPIARRLSDDVSVHALDYRGTVPGTVGYGDLGEIVEDFFGAIMRSKGAGDIVLVGHSFGGSVAFELAKRLESAGENVSLILLDSFLHQFSSASAGAHLQAAVPLDPHEKSDQPEWVANMLARRLSSPDVSDAMLAQFSESLLALLRIYDSYRPGGQVRGTASLVYAEAGVLAAEKDQVLSSISPYFENALDTLQAPGHHRDMLDEANAEKLALLLQQVIRKTHSMGNSTDE
ncbi:MAG: amino acid adenylation domain-containing protein, partial [Gammaproteobacteria bacterium]